MGYTEIEGDLIKLAQQGKFDVIVHGCNCFCTMGAGIAPQMAKAFGADEFPLEKSNFRGSINKLGMINYKFVSINYNKQLAIVNAYTQYGMGANHPDGTNAPLDYEALQLCLRKINHRFKGKQIGLPQIGCGLAGGKWSIVSKYIQAELIDMDITVVIYKKEEDESIPSD